MKAVNTKGVSLCCNAPVELLRRGDRQWYCTLCGNACQTRTVETIEIKETPPDPWIVEVYPTGPAWTGD